MKRNKLGIIGSGLLALAGVGCSSLFDNPTKIEVTNISMGNYAENDEPGSLDRLIISGEDKDGISKYEIYSGGKLISSKRFEERKKPYDPHLGKKIRSFMDFGENLADLRDFEIKVYDFKGNVTSKEF